VRRIGHEAQNPRCAHCHCDAGLRRRPGRTWAWALGNGSVAAAHNTHGPTTSAVAFDAVGSSAVASHALAIERKTGRVWAWGSNSACQLGPNADGAATMEFSIGIAGLPEIVEIAAGRGHSMAVDASGAVWCWGDNRSGQLGNGGNASSSTPTRASALNQD
jgi:alpha-tubulin suppressor-like RCC1 family protein